MLICVLTYIYLLFYVIRLLFFLIAEGIINIFQDCDDCILKINYLKVQKSSIYQTLVSKYIHMPSPNKI